MTEKRRERGRERGSVIARNKSRNKNKKEKNRGLESWKLELFPVFFNLFIFIFIYYSW